MQNTYENNWTIYFIAHFFMILGVQVPPGGSWKQSCKNGAKMYHFGKRVTSVVGLCFRACWLQNQICVHLFGV